MSDHPVFSDYKQASEYQLREWAEGRPWHNPWSPLSDSPVYGDLSEGECCPDFSCCCPSMIWAKERRYSFVAASGDIRTRMLLGALVNLSDPENVYVTGGHSND